MTPWIAACGTIVAALLAALFAYRNAQNLHRAQERLKRVNSQIAEFYGPLFAISEASEAAWVALRLQLRPDGGFFVSDLNEIERQLWKDWILSVFVPANRKMYDVIVANAHLLIGEEMPPELHKFCAHVACYEVIIHRWERGDDSELSAAIVFPAEVRPYIRKAFHQLKAQQQELLKLVRDRQIEG